MIDVKVLKDHMYDVISAIHEVHRELGSGINEFCYQEGLELELQERTSLIRVRLRFTPPIMAGPCRRAFVWILSVSKIL